MLARRRRILNVASIAAFLPGPWMSVYMRRRPSSRRFRRRSAGSLRQRCHCHDPPSGPDRSYFKTQAVVESRSFQGVVMDVEKVARAGFDGMMRGPVPVFRRVHKIFLWRSGSPRPRHRARTCGETGRAVAPLARHTRRFLHRVDRQSQQHQHPGHAVDGWHTSSTTRMALAPKIYMAGTTG